MTQADNNAIIKPQATSNSQNSALVSIIIPAYNTAQYIHRAIGSSLRQTHKNIEILIIDDGSTDDTLKVAEYFAGTDSRIRVFTQKNAGVSVARNHGIDEARGEYMYFLDSDDWLEDDAVESLLDAQNEHPDSLICAGSYGVRIEDTTLYRGKQKHNVNLPHGLIDLKYVADSYCWFSGNIGLFNACGKLFRTSFGVTFPEGMKWGEDAVFFMRYFCRIKSAYYLDKPIFNILERQGSASRCFVYTPNYTDSIVKSHKIITDLVKDNEEIYELMLKNRNLFFVGCSLRKVASARISRSEIQRIRNIVKPYAHYTLKSKRYPLKVKLNFFFAVFAPVPVYKAVVMMWELLKKFRRGKSEDAFADWQDFPKAPGM